MRGRVLGKRYRIDERIGQGGFGTVYRGTHLRLGDTVAVKVISAPHPGMIDRFHREAKLQRRLRHPAFVRLLDFDVEPDGLQYMVQEFVDGRTLKAILYADGALDPHRIAALTVDLLQALEEAHSIGIVHRDLKPPNIMLTDGLRGEEVRLLDFGIAKLFEDDENSAPLTQPHQIVGSVHYMAPEQIACQPLGPTTDLYQLGCVLYEACSGERPFTGAIQGILRKQMVVKPPELPSRVPPALAEVVMRALQKKPVDRFPSARQMRIALIESGLVPPDSVMRLPTTGEAPAISEAHPEARPADDGATAEQPTHPDPLPAPRPVPVPIPAPEHTRDTRPSTGDLPPTRALPTSPADDPTLFVKGQAPPLSSIGFDDEDVGVERTGPSFEVPDLGPPLSTAEPSTTGPSSEAPRRPSWPVIIAAVAGLALLALAVLLIGD